MAVSDPRGERLRRFPWPFTRDIYAYSANVEPAPARHKTAAGEWGGTILDIDDRYESELAERQAILARDPSRYTAMPHMRAAEWDALLWGLIELAAMPGSGMCLTRSGRYMIWENERLGLSQSFRFGDEGSLPVSPLVFLCSQIQDDAVLLDQREDRLWVDAGCVTFASNWSLNFGIGMSFMEIHGPVPRDYADGAIPRAEQFLLRLKANQPFRRMNWTSTAGDRLDTALDSYADWGGERRSMETATNLADVFHMRVEVQHLIRLPQTGAILFLIRTYLLPLRAILGVPAWRTQFASVLAHLPEDILQYKGLTKLRPRLLGLLEPSAVDGKVVVAV